MIRFRVIGIESIRALKEKVMRLMRKKKPQMRILNIILPQKMRLSRVLLLFSLTLHSNTHLSLLFSIILFHRSPTNRRPQTFFITQKSIAENMIA